MRGFKTDSTASRSRSRRSTATSPTCSSAPPSPTRCRTCGTPTGTTCSPCSRCRWRRRRSTWRCSSCRTTRRACRSARWRRSTWSRPSRKRRPPGRTSSPRREPSGRLSSRSSGCSSAARRIPLWNATIDPVERSDFSPVTIDLEAAVRRALSERTDLAIARKNLDVNDVTLKYLGNQLLPQADLVGTYGLVGLGGTQLITTGSGVNQQPVIGTIPGRHTPTRSRRCSTASTRAGTSR